MKKKRLKEIKQSVAQFEPAQEIKTYKHERVLGEKLIEDGIEKLTDGTIVDANKYYTKRVPVLGPVNYVNKIKELIKKGTVKIKKT